MNQQAQKPYKALVPGVNAFGGANISVTVGRGKNRRNTLIPHISVQTQEHHKDLLTTVKSLAGL